MSGIKSKSNVSFERSPWEERGPQRAARARARQNGFNFETLLARARARARRTQDPHHPEDPFQGKSSCKMMLTHTAYPLHNFSFIFILKNMDHTILPPSSPGSEAWDSFAIVSSEAPGTMQCLYNDVFLYILTDCRSLPGHKCFTVIL